MRILHLTTLLQGGAGRAIADLACAQQRAGHWVDVVASATAPEGYANYTAYLEQMRDAGVDLHLVDSMFSRELADNLHVVHYLLDRDLLSGTSVVHAHAATPALVGLLARGASGRRVPMVETMHGWGIRKTPAQQRADVAVMNTVERLVVPASSSAAVLRAAGVTREEIAVVAYGVDSADEDAEAPWDVMQLVQGLHRLGRTVFCCVGTIGERKNQVAIVDAMARLDDPARAACLFVGDGDPSALKAHADRLGVGHAVHVLGYRTDAPSVARASDWYILPSRSEGQPLSILEAYRDGVPVMASRIPELAELVHDGETGLLFDQDNPRALADRMNDALQMTREQLNAQRARARRRFDASFTLQAMVHGYADEYLRARTALHASGASTGAAA